MAHPEPRARRSSLALLGKMGDRGGFPSGRMPHGQRIRSRRHRLPAPRRRAGVGTGPRGRIDRRRRPARPGPRPLRGVAAHPGKDFLLTVLRGMARNTADEAVKKGGPELATAAIACAAVGPRRVRSRPHSAPSPSSGSTSPASPAVWAAIPPTPNPESTAPPPPEQSDWSARPAGNARSTTPRCS